MRKLFVKIIGVLGGLSIVFFLLHGVPVLAQGLNLSADQVSGLGLSTSTDLKTTIVSVLKVVLGLVGLVAVGFVVYGGAIWMTSQGDEGKIKLAKKIVVSAVIGMVVVIFSYSIVTFVSNAFGESGGGAAGGSTCAQLLADQGGIGFCCPGNTTPSSIPCSLVNPSSFTIASIKPNTGIVPRNANVVFTFSGAVNFQSIDDTSVVVTNQVGQVISGSFELQAANQVAFKPSTPCGPQAPSSGCFDANSTVHVHVNNKILSTNNVTLSCSMSSTCDVTFSVNDIIDVSDPAIFVVTPSEGAAVVRGLNTFELHATDDGGVANLALSVDGVNFFAPTSPDLQQQGNTATCVAPGCVTWLWKIDSTDPNQNTQQPMVLFARVYDFTSRSAQTVRNYRLIPSFCGNGTKDADKGETGIDCGGPCGACDGSSCKTNNTCSSDNCNRFSYCVKSTCVCAPKPVIEGMDAGFGMQGSSGVYTVPGAADNFVTIVGQRFGTSGKVFFGDKPAKTTSCVSWAPNQIVVQVPAGALNNVQVSTDEGGVDFSRDSLSEPQIDFNLYTDNTKSAPGLCTVVATSTSKPQGRANLDALTLTGQNFGSAAGSISFGGQLINQSTPISWATSSISSVITPNVQPGVVSVTVKDTKGAQSNPVSFEVQDPNASAQPFIESIDPVNASVGSYVTIRGRGFGSSRGNRIIKFKNISGEYEAGFDFPADCAGGLWSDTQIIVKVPSGLPVGAANASTVTMWSTLAPIVQQSNIYGSQTSETKFTTDPGTALPGVCLLSPVSNIWPTNQNIFSGAGDNFGAAGTVEVPGTKNPIAVTLPTSKPGTFTFTTQIADNISTGIVKYVRTSDGKKSNGIAIDVTDVSKLSTIGSAWYEVRFTTNEDPSGILVDSTDCTGAGAYPSPKPGTQDACVNAFGAFAFKYPAGERADQPIVRDSMAKFVSGSTIVGGMQAFQCSKATPQDCDADPSAWAAAGDLKYDSSTNNPFTQYAKFVLSAGNWAANTWYRLVLPASETAPNGFYYDDRFGKDVHLPQTYITTFKTQSSADVCQVSSVGYSESDVTMYVGWKHSSDIGYVGTNCQMLRPTAGGTVTDVSSDKNLFSLLPGSTDSPGYTGSTQTMTCSLSSTAMCTRVSGLGAKATAINSFVSHQIAYKASNAASSSLYATQKVVVKEVPFAVLVSSDCSAGHVPSPSPYDASHNACPNGSVVIQFTKPILSSSVTGNILLNGSTTSLLYLIDPSTYMRDATKFTVIAYNNSNVIQVLPPLAGFTPGATYSFSVTTGIRTSLEGNSQAQGSFSDVGLKPAVGSEAYKFTFQTATTPCTIDTVDLVTSTQKIGIGSGSDFGKKYVGVAKSASCQTIDPTSLTWSFEIADGSAKCFPSATQIGNTNTANVKVAGGLAASLSCYDDTQAAYTGTVKVAVKDSAGLIKPAASVLPIYSPYIDSTSNPSNGSARIGFPTAITLLGKRFGTKQEGSASFIHVDGDVALNIAPGSVIPAIDICGVWGDTVAVIGTPVLTALSPSVPESTNIFVHRNANDYATMSDSNYLPFSADTTIRPIICSVTPSAGTSGDQILVNGDNFGSVQQDTNSVNGGLLSPSVTAQ